MTTRSWGHTAGTLPPAQRGYPADSGDPWSTLVPYRCATRDCGDDVSCWTAARFRAGRSQREMLTVRVVCAVHAAQFASRWDIVVTADPPPATATRTIIGQVPNEVTP